MYVMVLAPAAARWRFNINEGLELLKLADIVLSLINPSPCYVKSVLTQSDRRENSNFSNFLLHVENFT